MRGRNKIYRWLIALWLLLSCESGWCAYQPATSPTAWRTTPTLSEEVRPAYQFRSTSVYAPTTSVTVYSPGSSTPFKSPYRPRRDDIDEEEDPEGDPTGYIDTPVGEPMVLLLMAMLYTMVCIIYRMKRNGSTD